MEEASQIALITAGASIAGGFVGQFLSLFYQNRVSQLERVRMVEARSAQLYLREIEAYDALIPGLAGVLYVARELSKDPLLRKPRQSDEVSAVAYQAIQDRVRNAVSGHLAATAANYHVIGSEAINRIDQTARRLFEIIDEATAPVSGGTPLTQERATILWNEMEDLRVAMLEFCWESLDVHHLENSFRTLKEPLEKASSRGPSILEIDLEWSGEERQRV